jgi:hypothetical protein
MCAATRLYGFVFEAPEEGRMLLSAVAVLLWQRALLAQGLPPPQYREQPAFDLKAFGSPGDWKAVVTAVVEPQREIEADEGLSQSRICFVRAAPANDECSYFQDLFHSNLTFQEFSSLSVARLRSGSAATNGLVLKAEAWYPTGQVHETAIWVYDARLDGFELVAALESSDVRIFDSGPLNGTLVTADWDREEGETRWSGHQREIGVYRYGVAGGVAGYRKILQYATTRKYGAEDTHTIDAELPRLEANAP